MGVISEMLRQIDSKVPGVRKLLAAHGQRFAVWADSERRNDTCALCTKLDPTFDCNAHIDSRAGRDSSYHPEFPECVEGGGADRGLTTMLVEEYGIPWLEPGASTARPSASAASASRGRCRPGARHRRRSAGASGARAPPLMPACASR